MNFKDRFFSNLVSTRKYFLYIILIISTVIGLGFGVVQLYKNFELAWAYGNPTISSISPNSSSTLGGIDVTINGANFTQGLPQRIITITNPTGNTITNYEGNITLDTASLITANKLRSDCGDIRVKDSDGNTDINYWIDGDCNSSNTIVWFKKPSLPVGDSTVVLKYGDSALTSQSNINNFSFGSVLTGSNVQFWYSANAGTGTSTDGSQVANWNDRSSQTNNASRATSINQPTVRNNIINSKPVLRFDGSNDSLVVNNQARVGQYVSVFKSNTSTFNNYGGVLDIATNVGCCSTRMGIFEPGTSHFHSNPLPVAVRRNGSALSSPFSLSPITSPMVMSLNSQNPTLVRPMIIGAPENAYFANIDIAEIIALENVPSLGDTQIVETYLNSKYNLYGTNPIVVLGNETINSVSVTFGGVAGTNLQYISSTELRVRVPASTLPGDKTGSLDVVVTNSDGTSVIFNNGFTYGVPSISSITPSSSSTMGAVEVTINGANFANSGYKRIITINNTGGVLTDYQTNFSLNTQELISAGKMKVDCGDIRVFDTDETTALNYWVESGCNTATTTIWTKIPSISANSNKEIFVKYGDSSKTSAQTNPDNIFEFYDGFDGGVIDSTKWINNNTAKISQNNKLIFNGGNGSWGWDYHI